MMRYTINLSTRIHLDQRLINRILFSIVFILSAGLLSVSLFIFKSFSETGRLYDDITRLQGRLGIKSVNVNATEVNRQRDRVRFYNSVIQRKGIDWMAKLDLFETALPEGVSVTSLAPGKNIDEWKIEGRTRSFKTVQKLLESMESSTRFSDVMLLSHKNSAPADKEQGVSFTVACRILK